MRILAATYLILLMSTSFAHGQAYGESPQQTIISGQVLHHEDHPEIGLVEVYINDLTLDDQRAYSGELDEDGYFSIPFELYLSQGVLLKYQSLIEVYLHPGDSFHVVFDGNTTDYAELYQDVQYSGGASVENKQLATYLQDNHPSWEEIMQESKNQQQMLPETYRAWRDSVTDQMRQQQRQFVEQTQPFTEIAQYTFYHVELKQLMELLYYAGQSLQSKNPEYLGDSYFSFLEEMPQLTMAALANPETSFLVNYYRHSYLLLKIIDEHEGNPEFINNSDLFTREVVRLSHHDSLLRALVLYETVNESLLRQDVEPYENQKDLIDRYIQPTFLKNALQAHYEETKSLRDHPQLAAESQLENLTDIDESDLFDTLLQKNHNKLIYIDVWATWCGPCISEFPRSKELHAQLKGQNISFVYLCIDSEEDKWKAMLAKFQLPGQHYLLSKKQSAFLKSEFQFSGIPYYMLINQQGQVVSSGFDLRPSGNAIKEMLDKLL